ncbi:MAG: ABC transporter permease [Firmicutes bacterium]|nr:ABC transporter permease [Bacillota bacterium]
MSFSDIVKMCKDNLWRRKGRTFLTVLGVFIGCTSIIVMVSIGVGMKESQDQMLTEMGDLSIIEVSKQYNSDKNNVKLDDNAVESFRSIEGVAAVMPKASMEGFSVVMKAGINDRYYCDWASIVGIDTDAMEAMGFEILEGKVPGVRADEAVGGQYLAYNFYDSLMPEGYNMVDRWGSYDENGNETKLPDPFFDPLKTPVTLEINMNDGTDTVHRKTLQITGITKEDYGKGWETSEGIMMSIDAMKALIKEVKGSPKADLTYSTVLVKAADISLVSQIEEEIAGMGYNTYSMESMRESMEKSARQVQLMLGGIGAISLFVAAIGITNTMIMSISERTREIGIMKALGCYVKDIRLMFLMEAGAIGLIGGIMGVIFSLVISVIINLVTMGVLSSGLTGQMVLDALIGGEGITRTSVVSLGLIIFAIGFSIFVGVASGYYPANKAVKISALEAIKRE